MSSYSSEANVGVQASGGSRSLPRRDLFAGLIILGCVNGLGAKVIAAVNQTGLVDAIFSTTNVSIIVWASCLSGLALILKDQSGDATKADFWVGAAFLAMVVLPVGELSWVALAGLSIYILRTSHRVPTRQGAFILLATTVPMLWSVLLFKLFANSILAVDASLVSWLLGTARVGNVVRFADGSGDLVILHQCSSLANVSQAMLCWITISRLINHKKSPYDMLWCAAACASVVAVNVVRMTLMGLSEPMYDVAHGPTGNAIASAMMLALMISVCLLGVRRELFGRV